MDCFSLGSIVVVKTMHDDIIEGQVMAFDLNTKLLILKNNSDSSKLNNVYIINLPHCKDVTVKKEIIGAENQEPQSINLQRLSNRIRNQVDQKKRLVVALKANVSEEGQNLYMSLTKTLTADQVYWNGTDIVVFDDVIIKPPYKPENVESKKPGKQRDLDYIKKMVMSRQKQASSSETSSNNNKN